MKAVISFILIVLAFPLFAQNYILKEGNKAYDAGKYGQAFELYEKASARMPVKAAYNSGAALYKLQDYGAASSAFENAIQEPHNKSEALLNQNAMYNLGNAAYKAGDKEKGKQAMRMALLMNLKDKDAQENLQFMIKEEQAQKQSQQQKDNPQQDQKDNQKDNQENQDKQKQNQNQQQDQQQQDKQKQEQQEKDSSAKEEAASVLQMAQEHKQDLPKQEPRSNQIEKDW